MKRRTLNDIDAEITESKLKLAKIEEEYNSEFENCVHDACRSILNGEKKWIPVVYWECDMNNDDDIRREILKFVALHKDTCISQNCNCQILSGIVLCRSHGSLEDGDACLSSMTNDSARSICACVFQNGTHRNPFFELHADLTYVEAACKFFDDYHFIPWWIYHNPLFKKWFDKSALLKLYGKFQYNPYIYNGFFQCKPYFTREDEKEYGFRLSDAKDAITCDFDSHRSYEIPDWMRANLENGDNSSFKAIASREARRKARKLLLLCARAFAAESPLHKDNLPLDMFKIVAALADVLAPAWFY